MEGLIIYLVVSVILFLLMGVTGGSLGDALLVGIFWPICLIYLFVSLFWGAGKWL